MSLKNYEISKGLTAKISTGRQVYFEEFNGLLPDVALGNNNDYAIDIQTNDIYLKTGGVWAKTGISAQLDTKRIDFRYAQEIFEDFTNGLIGVRYSSSFTGGQFVVVSPGNNFGVFRLRTSTSATANQRATLLTTATAFLIGQGRQLTKVFRFAFSENLPDATRTGQVRLGFGDNTNGESVDSVMFRIINDANLFTVTRSNNIETVTNLGFRPVLGQFYKFKIVCNSAGTQVDFYIDDMITPVATHTTNIPITVGRELGELFYVHRAAALAQSISIDLDWDYLKVLYATPLEF